jgi:hypothetical protein
LKRDGYVDHDNQPFCQPCYNRLFGPKGFGHSMSESTTVTPPVTTTTSNPAPPPPQHRPSAGTGKVTIGTTSKASEHGLYKEAAYVGDNDEVDDSEW